MSTEIVNFFEQFLKRVFIEKKSFLSGNCDDTIYEINNLKTVKKLYVDLPIYFDKDNLNSDHSTKYMTLKNELGKDPNFFEKINLQFEEADDSIKMIFSDILWLRYLPIYNIGNDKKKDACCSLGVIKPEYVQDKIPQKEKGVAGYGQYIQWINSDIKFLINIFIKLLDSLKDKRYEINDVKKIIVGLILGDVDFLDGDEQSNINGNIQSKLKNRVPIASMLLYLCEPQNHEPIASFPHKFNIIKFFGKKYSSKNNILTVNNTEIDISKPLLLSFKQIEEALKQIKNEIIKDKELSSYFDNKGFYHYKIREMWDNMALANIEEIFEKYKKQIILYGAPGTGKTYNAEIIRDNFIKAISNNYETEAKLDNEVVERFRFSNICSVYREKSINIVSSKIVEADDSNKDNRIGGFKVVEADIRNIEGKEFLWEIIQLNQSYSYEDFIEGLYPTSNGELYIRNGIFKNICNAACSNPDTKFLLIIDEINRGKIDRIFGELLYALEYRGKPVRLHYSGDDLIVPKDNLYILGTMNTADKSIAMIDIALRRRFWFVKLNADRNLLLDKFQLSDEDINYNSEISETKHVKVLAIKLFDFLNGSGKKNSKGKIEDIFKNDAEGREIGHSYFDKLYNDDNNIVNNNEDPYELFERMRNIWFFSIIPLLEEYCNYNRDMLNSLLKFSKGNLSNPKDFSQLFDKLEL